MLVWPADNLLKYLLEVVNEWETVTIKDLYNIGLDLE